MIRRLGLLAAVVGGLAALYAAGVIDQIRDVERMRASLESLGAWGPVLYVLCFSLLEPFFVPGIAFVIPGALVFSFPELLVYSWLGSIGAGVVGFAFARTLGRSFVERHLPASLHRYDRRLAENGLQTVIWVRLALFLAPPAHWLLGLSRVRFGEFVLGTAIGFLPGVALMTYAVVFFGTALGPWLASQPAWVWAVLVAVVAGGVLLRRLLASPRTAPDVG